LEEAAKKNSWRWTFKTETRAK